MQAGEDILQVNDDAAPKPFSGSPSSQETPSGSAPGRLNNFISASKKAGGGVADASAWAIVSLIWPVVS
jgi:hypothetical protein